MDPVLLGLSGLAVALALVALRVPVGIALGLVSFVGIAAVLSPGAAWGILAAAPFHFVGDWNLTAVPMFLLMGYVASSAGLTGDLFHVMRLVLARLPGGLAVASVGACAVFAAASGSSVATAAAMARIATPEMLRYRYDPGLAAGVVAASGTLGSIIPPSIILILYGYFAEVSIGKLFVAGIVPGILSAVIYGLMIVVRVVARPSLAPPIREPIDWAAVRRDLRGVWPVPALILGVLLGIFVGIFTPTEAGAVGACLALVIVALKGRLSRAVCRDAVSQTLRSTAGVFMVVIGTVLLTRFMALSGVPTRAAEWLIALGSGPYLVILLTGLLYIFLGMFVDSIGLLLLTLPILLPVVHEARMDLVWYGILIVKLLEVGMVTPPVGINVYVIKSTLGDLVTLPEVFRGVGWFIAMDLLTLVVLAAFPGLSLWLPGLME